MNSSDHRDPWSFKELRETVECSALGRTLIMVHPFKVQGALKKRRQKGYKIQKSGRRVVKWCLLVNHDLTASAATHAENVLDWTCQRPVMDWRGPLTGSYFSLAPNHWLLMGSKGRAPVDFSCVAVRTQWMLGALVVKIHQLKDKNLGLGWSSKIECLHRKRNALGLIFSTIKIN